MILHDEASYRGASDNPKKETKLIASECSTSLVEEEDIHDHAGAENGRRSPEEACKQTGDDEGIVVARARH